MTIIVINILIVLSDLVNEHHDEGICDASRVFFLDSAHRLSHAALDTETPSVNIRGIMDPVSTMMAYLLLLLLLLLWFLHSLRSK